LSGLRWLARSEGVSLLVLVLVAMPLKYVGHRPDPVRVVGMLHGLLFLGLLMRVLQARVEGSLTTGQALRITSWAVVPFGFFAVERTLRCVEGARGG
jgi:integral membrane protein